MNQRRLWIAVALFVSVVGVSDASAQETIGSFSYAELSEGSADRSSIATFGYNYEGGLVWKCEADGLNVLFILPQDLSGGSASQIDIEYGFGGAAPGNRQSWGYSASDMLATMPQAAVAEFTRAARGAGAIAVKATDPASGNSGTYQLTLDQLGAALGRLECAG
ncbi:MAG: hypothetical protein WD766_13530 [Gemmatimonadota bacterium]